MTHKERHCCALSFSGIPLEGHKIVRTIYVDESGTDAVKNPTAVVVGIIIDADRQWEKVEAYVKSLIDEYIPEDSRDGFPFHAKDMWHGTGKIFNRERMPRERAVEALRKHH